MKTSANHQPHHPTAPWRSTSSLVRRPEEHAARLGLPLTVSTSFYTPMAEHHSGVGAFKIKEEAPERVTTLPVFADLIRASHLAGDMSPLPSLVSKSSLSFILDGEPKQELVPRNSMDSAHSPSSEDDDLDGRYDHRSAAGSDALGQFTIGSKRKARPANRTCKFEGCEQYVVDHGLCVRHGGGKRCTMEGCTSRAKHYGRCWRHGGSMECKITGCVNRAKSRGFCWSHGGGTKCKGDDCEKIAISNGLCWAHGGGKRCAFAGCMKQAYERTLNLCNAHFQQAKRDPLRQVNH